MLQHNRYLLCPPFFRLNFEGSQSASPITKKRSAWEKPILYSYITYDDRSPAMPVKSQHAAHPVVSSEKIIFGTRTPDGSSCSRSRGSIRISSSKQKQKKQVYVAAVVTAARHMSLCVCRVHQPHENRYTRTAACCSKIHPVLVYNVAQQCLSNHKMPHTQLLVRMKSHVAAPISTNSQQLTAKPAREELSGICACTGPVGTGLGTRVR